MRTCANSWVCERKMVCSYVDLSTYARDLSRYLSDMAAGCPCPWEIEISNLFHYHFLSAGSSHNEKKKEAILRMSRLYYYLNIVNNHKLNALNVEQFYCWTF